MLLRFVGQAVMSEARGEVYRLRIPQRVLRSFTWVNERRESMRRG